MYVKFVRIALIFLVFVSSSACSLQLGESEIESPSTDPVDTLPQSTLPTYPSDVIEEPIPYPTTDLSSYVYQPYPYPVEFAYEEPPKITPDPLKGSVSAVIFYKGEPLKFTTFFLADVIKSEKTGLEAATSLDRSIAPRIVSNQDGLLLFENIIPGRYGLIMASGMDTFLLLYPGRQEAILLTVEAGKQVELGEIDFEDLPLD